MKHADKVSGKQRDSVSFHRLLVISLQILTVLLSLKKAEKEEFKFRKVWRTGLWLECKAVVCLLFLIIILICTPLVFIADCL